jgi:hypothetical protein
MGSLLGGLLAWRRVGPARAHNHCGGCPPGHVCSAGGVCLVQLSPGLDHCTAQGLRNCGGVCVDIQEDIRNCGGCGVRCRSGESCAQGRCFSFEELCTGAGLTYCGEATCVDLATHSRHCGACHNSCGLGANCEDGACVSSGYWCTTQGLTECDGMCVNTLTNDNYCGGCEFACYGGASCVNGDCV